jgi:catechol 2,3-dioxygenase-like lactoylglutathione lyase family enzyme
MAIYVSDLRRAEEFYSRHFGFKRYKTFNAGQPNEFCMMESEKDGGMIELFHRPQSAGEAPVPTPIGFNHLCFLVDDVDAYHERLKDEVTFHVAPRDADVFRIAFFKDPDGVVVELLQERK